MFILMFIISLKRKKVKYEFKNTFGKVNDDMPDEYKHPRHGLRSARVELYTVMSKFTSELHMSKRQTGAIVTIVNMLFGWEWKTYNKHQTTDLDTLYQVWETFYKLNLLWSNDFESYSWRNNERWHHYHCIRKWWFVTKWGRILCCLVINNKWRAMCFAHAWYSYRIKRIISSVGSNHT